MNLINRLALLASQVLFSAITPLLLIPAVADRKATRSFIAFLFGRSYGNRYQSIIDSFQGRYGLAMAQGLKRADNLAGDSIAVIADCGTGTGFVTRQAAEVFPHAAFIAFDLLPGMLKQARENCKGLSHDVFHVQADSFALPLADGSVDLLLAQNTMPCFTEFARVVRPDGLIIYVDSSAGWIAGLAGRLVERQGLFESVEAEKVDIGFCVIAQQKGDGQRQRKKTVEGVTREEKLLGLLRCPHDRTLLATEGNGLRCEQGHHFPVQDGFPVLLPPGTSKDLGRIQAG